MPMGRMGGVRVPSWGELVKADLAEALHAGCSGAVIQSRAQEVTRSFWKVTQVARAKVP